MQQIIEKARRWLIELAFSDIHAALAARRIDVMVLKGPHLEHALYRPLLREREYIDLDILVRPGNFERAARVLLEIGYKPLFWRLRRLATHAANYNWGFLSPRQVMVDLHRGLVSTDQYRIDVNALFSRAEEFRFGAVPALGLGGVDLLGYLCLHMGKRHFSTSEAKHLQDIALFVKERGVDWDSFAGWVNTARSRAVAYYCLVAARMQHGADIPDPVLEGLRPGGLQRRFLQRCLDPQNFPVCRLDQDASFRNRLMILALIDRWGDRLRFLARFAWRGLLDRLLRVAFIRSIWLRRRPNLAKLIVQVHD